MFNGTLKYFLFAGIAILLAGVFALLQTNSELSVVMTSDAAGKGEVFYAKKYRFSQKQRLFFQYARGKTRSVLRLDADLKDLTLRLDPAVEKNVNVEIRQLVIKTPNLKKITIRGRELAQCPKYNLTVQVPTSQRYFACRSVNYDPQIFIDLKKVGKSSFYVHPVIFFFWGLLILDILVCWKRKWVIQLALSCWEKGKNNICILRKKIPWISADGWCYLFLLLLFFASYGIGFTTSSLGYAKVAGADVILHGERKLLGTYRGFAAMNIWHMACCLPLRSIITSRNFL